jgi:hypothetical protein
MCVVEALGERHAVASNRMTQMQRRERMFSVSLSCCVLPSSFAVSLSLSLSLSLSTPKQEFSLFPAFAFSKKIKKRESRERNFNFYAKLE